MKQDKRYEKKFVIEEQDKREVEHSIIHNPIMFLEIFSERIVNNIYFDYNDFKNYEENVNGNTDRIKIRIRWYGRTFGFIENPVLELKIKNNELGEKKSFKLKSFNLNENFSLDLLREVFLESNIPDWLIEELKFVFPSLLNSYKRKYYLSKDKKFRVTLDSDLNFIEIKERNNTFLNRFLERERLVLEIKYHLKDYESEKLIGRCFPYRLVANSKYKRGIELINDIQH